MPQRLPHQLAISLSVVLLSCAITVMADEARWQQYMHAGEEAYQGGDYGEAVRQFQFGLKESEHFGEEDARFAQSLNDLAFLYQAQGRLDEAEPLYERSLAIREETLGPGAPGCGHGPQQPRIAL